jgi:hypothetical protein
VDVFVKPPGVEITVYRVIAEPPLSAGAKKETVALVLPKAPVTLVGGSGTVDGVTPTDAIDEALVPRMFVAVTVNV